MRSSMGEGALVQAIASSFKRSKKKPPQPHQPQPQPLLQPPLQSQLRPQPPTFQSKPFLPLPASLICSNWRNVPMILTRWKEEISSTRLGLLGCLRV